MDAYQAHEMLDVMVDTKAAAQILKRAPQTLRAWRCMGGGPVFHRITKSGYRYRVRDLLRYMDGN